MKRLGGKAREYLNFSRSAPNLDLPRAPNLPQRDASATVTPKRGPSGRKAHFQERIFMSAAVKHVSDATFDKDVLQSGHPVLVDFWAEWCGPCKMFAPVLDEVAKEYGGKITVAKLDIDAHPSTPGKYGIRGIPTVILYKGGQAHAQKVGALTKSQLTAWIDSNIETAIPSRSV